MIFLRKKTEQNNHSVFDFFPTPKFLEMPAPGLSLNDEGIRMITFVKTKNSVELGPYGKFTFDVPRIRNGEILDKEGLISDLSTFRKQFGITHVRASLPEEKAYLFGSIVPFSPGEDLRGTIESMIEENVPLSVSEAVFDYSIVSQEQRDGAWFAHVSVSVIAQDIVSEYLDIFKSAGFLPLHFDVESQAIAKAVIPKNNQEVILIVNITKEKVGFYISDTGVTSFSSISNLSSWDTPVGQTQSTAQNEIMDGLKKILLYWQTQSDKKGEKVRPFVRCLLVGDMAKQNGIDEEINTRFGIKTEKANVWQNAFSFEQYVPPLSKDESLSYAAAVGLGLINRH